MFSAVARNALIIDKLLFPHEFYRNK